LMHH
jgi:CO dehydrogenase/acetyl-CoA synthase delta subunit (corrinoid Fe-S protein)